MSGKIRLFLVEINRQNLEFHRRAFLHVEQQFEHRIAVFSARQTNHHLIAVFNHRKIADGFAHFLEQFRFRFRFYKQFLSDTFMYNQFPEAKERFYYKQRICTKIPAKALIFVQNQKLHKIRRQITC